MSRPTEEQIKALKLGDRVLVEAVVRCATPDSDGEISIVGHRYVDWLTSHCLPAAIHSILPREIKVGDRVRHLGWDEAPWEVLAGPRPCKSRPAEYAIWREGDGFVAVSADSLEVVS